MTSRRLQNPPIREAIISVSFKGDLTINQLEPLCNDDTIKRNYPKQNKLFSAKVEIGKGTARSSQKHEGFTLSCGENCNKSIKVGLGQLSFHNTIQYLGWDDFYGEFRSIWKIFCEKVGKRDLTTLSVRYINQLKFELPLKFGFEEHINLLPNIPDGISNNLNGFFIQLNVPNETNTMTGIVTETFTNSPPGFITITLDLNVIKQQTFVCNSDEMWKSFDEIRTFKNQLFFSCLTEKTIKRYE